MEPQESSNGMPPANPQSFELGCSLQDLVTTAERLLEAARQFKLSE
jgi:hypothetical protein